MVYLVLALVIIVALLIIVPWREITEHKIKSADSNNEVLPDHFRYASWNKGFNVDVVGESYYQDSLLLIAGPKKSKSKNIDCHAVLIREPDNAHDPNAVMVVIKGKLVGYLKKSMAKRFSEEWRNLGLTSKIMLVVAAKINGGWKDSSSEGNFGVVLDMPPINRISSVISSISMEDSEIKFKNRNSKK
ncbi:hypothetical protein HX037_06375 [Ignatzschineria indica]|uniref:HIRAN domain-containing protein n=1 Tax=Ignatzschineria indica TaxID=472583 RepID=UPI002578CC2C|nr:HIRAN domain-containing protein [Ignatzschineria indica]MDM1545510.1 hypothetical protein [Ignatzschineria indica]